jgi:Fe-S cluster assembly protein SufD
MKEVVLFKNTASFTAPPRSTLFEAKKDESRFAFLKVNEGNGNSEVLIHAHSNSVLEVVIFQNIPENQEVLIQVNAKADSNATVRLTVIQQGGLKAEIRIDSEASGENARFEMKGLQNAKGAQQFLIKADSRHPVPHTTSDMQVWCAARDTSRSVFNGLIDIKKNAHHTEAFQKNRNLLLSDRATIDSFPKLLIANDAVKCAHGSSTSTLEPDQANYLRSRGIPGEEADQMLVQGFLRQALAEISNEECQGFLYRELGIEDEGWV